MRDYLKKRMMRLGPLIALALLIVIIGPDRLQQLHGTARWAIFLCFLVALITPVLLAVRSGLGLPTKNTTALEGYARKLWNAMLIFNVLAFVAGSVAVVVFYKAVPVRYTILAPCVNLLLIILLWRILHSARAG